MTHTGALSARLVFRYFFLKNRKIKFKNLIGNSSEIVEQRAETQITCSNPKWAATVAYTGHECDMAILDVAEADFWKDLPTGLLELGHSVRLQARALAPAQK